MQIKYDSSPTNPPSLKDRIYPDKRFKYNIPVDVFIDYFGIKNPEVKTVLHQYPTLVYLLGNITSESQGIDSRPDNVSRPVFYLKEGSAMFALENKVDAMRWRGIFNHVMGTARHVYYLSEVLRNLSDEKKQRFGQFGFDIETFKLDPELLRDFMFISHSRRRETDEKTWHQLDDDVHKEVDPGKATMQYLQRLNVDPAFLDLLRVEQHDEHLIEAGKTSFFPNIIDNILTYCDWTFGQSPNTLSERFNGLRKSQRASPEMLRSFEKCGQRFETALTNIVNPNIWHEMTTAGPYKWETEIRKAYCAPSGLTLPEAFPLYVKQFPTVQK